jgi:AraC-like DNA-binding protein
MIVAQLSDPQLRKAVRHAARRDEDVVVDGRRVLDAIDVGFPRLIMKSDDMRLPPVPPGIPVVVIDASTRRRWEAERRGGELPLTRQDFATRSMTALIAEHALERTWVDAAMADLARAAGMQLPPALRGFARRILEFPVHYTNLRPLAEACNLSRGALKAKFRRRDLSSPYTYQRWFRVIAVAHLLADRSVTVAVAAERTGFTSDGNLCRMMASLCEMTPTNVRSVLGWNRLLISFAWQHLTPEALEAWSALDELFDLRVA